MPAQANPAPERIEQAEPSTATEPLYRVLIHNDEVTPMDFVVRLLSSTFLIPALNAEQIMYQAHFNGLAYVQTLPRPEARRRINKAHFAARLAGYPLAFTMEPA
jgi:ATP-dependent Clp protease adaptor protein ClpS